MPNPFPSVDPYLEDQAYWRDFHQRFNTYCCDALFDTLPDDYEARIDERVNLVALDDGDARLILPDVAVVHRPQPVRGPRATAATLTIEPVTLPMEVLAEDRQTFIQILHRPDRTLIAILELLSPANNAGSGVRDYLVRRQAILRQEVHLVEFDLLIGGARLPVHGALPRGDFYAFVTRADRFPDSDAFGWTLRQPLPTIPIPLKAPDPDVLLDLQAVYATTYERGRYTRSVDRMRPLDVPLAPEDRAWAEEQDRALRPERRVKSLRRDPDPREDDPAARDEVRCP